MGDSERWPELVRGLSPEGTQSFQEAFATYLAKGDEWWAKAELRAAELITSIQPNEASEQRRQAVIDYVTSLIQKSCVPCQVFTFGSVPLKTYLPDGDIDLTAFSPSPDVKRSWIQDVHNILQKAKENPNSKFRVKEVQLIHAEVKIVKCFVENILVDVSFDQLGGVCTLCFLEEVDRLIGENHLFKRSIILVKAWCYYESRILGAHCGLMSTYALETLVLYIFQFFHASLRGPLQVLYLFLEFFSNFDWDKYCVSLSNPILLPAASEETERRSLLPEDLQNLALSPRREGGELRFSKAFLDDCETKYGLVPLSQISKPNKFTVKSLNISDPLRSMSNLGRSVNQGNSARIRRAFVLGARTLRSILNGSDKDVSSELDQFFKNCNLRLHGSLPDVGSPKSWGTKVPSVVQESGAAKRDIAKSETSDHVPHSSLLQNGIYLEQTEPNHGLPCGRKAPDAKESLVRESSQLTLGFGGGFGGYPVLWSQLCAPAVATAPVRKDSMNESAVSPKSFPGNAVGLKSGDKEISSDTCVSLGSLYLSRHTGEESVASVIKTPGQISSLVTTSDRLPTASGTDEESDLLLGICREVLRNGSEPQPRRGLERPHLFGANMEVAGVLKQGAIENGNRRNEQHSTSTSSSTCSRIDSEEDEDYLSQSSSRSEAIVSEDITTIVGSGRLSSPTESSPVIKEALLNLPCLPGNIESIPSTRKGSSSMLEAGPLDPRHPTSNVAADTQVQAPSQSEHLGSAVNEEECGFSVPVELHKQTESGGEYLGVMDACQSKGLRRKGRTQRDHHSGVQSKDLEGSGVVVHDKPRRVLCKANGAWSVDDGTEKVQCRVGVSSQVEEASLVGSSLQSPVPVSGHQDVYPSRHSSTDATGGAPFKTLHSHPYPTSVGPVFRHPPANFQFDPGTLRMPTGNSTPCYLPVTELVSSSHSSPPQYLPTFVPAPLLFPPGFPPPSINKPGTNMQNRNSPAKGYGSSGIIVKNRSDQETNGSVEVPVETLGDCPSNNSQSKIKEQQIGIGVVERLEAEGISASTSSKTSHTDGAEPSGRSTTEFLTSNLQLHLESLAFGQSCEWYCSPSSSHVVHPAFASDKHAHKHGSWEGPGRPDAALRPQFVAPQFYAPHYYAPQLCAGYPPYAQPFWTTRGVELIPRPRGTGTYLPNTQLRQSIKTSGKGRTGGQNGSSHQEEKYHHHSREYEGSHHFHGPHHRAQVNKEEAHVQAGYGFSNKVVENRGVKTERVRDPHHPKQEFERGTASHSHPTEPSVASPVANPGEAPYSSELMLHTDCDLNVSMDVSELCDSSGPPVVQYPVLHESNLSSELSPVEFLSSGEALPGVGERNGPLLRSAYDEAKSDDPAAMLALPTTIGEVLPSTSTSRNGRPTYQMKEEDFPPLGGPTVSRAEIATGCTDNNLDDLANGTTSNLDTCVSL